MIAVELSTRTKRWVRFLLGGCVNTGFSYVIYLALSTVLSYQFAYFFAYALGVFFAYLLNVKFVFRVALTWTGFFTYPLVYVVQYIFSALFLGAMVETLRVDKSFAPLLVTVVSIPLTYFINKLLLRSEPSAGCISRLKNR